MSDTPIRRTRAFSVCIAAGYVVLSCAYAVTLALGLAFLPSPDEPISEPYFTLLELLILTMCPFLVALFADIHIQADADTRLFSLVALVFAALLAGVTACVHFAILVLSRQPEIAALSQFDLLLSFRWPSLVYVFDILAWDVFFPLAAVFAAPAIRTGPFAATVRALFRLSGALAAAGLAGILLSDMQVRNIGIIGYAGIFPVAALLLALRARRENVVKNS